MANLSDQLNHLSEPEQARGIVDNSLRYLTTAIEHPEYPDYLKALFLEFKDKVVVRSDQDFTAKLRQHILTDPKTHPILTELSISNLSLIADSDAYTLYRDDEVIEVMVKQSHAIHPVGSKFLYRLLAEEFGHMATQIANEKIPLKTLPKRFYLAEVIDHDLSYLRSIEGLGLTNPDTLVLWGWLAKYADDEFGYIRSLDSLDWEELRAKMLALHLMGYTLMTHAPNTFKDEPDLNMATENLYLQASLYPDPVKTQERIVIELGEGVGWSDVVKTAFYGSADDFIELCWNSNIKKRASKLIGKFLDIELDKNS